VSENVETYAIANSKLTSELTEMFCQLIAAGNYYHAACKAVGISYHTFNKWMRYGEQNSETPYGSFYNAVRKADAAAELWAVHQWRKAFPYDWKAAAEFLARRFPDRWARREHITIALDQEVQRMMGQLEKTLPREVFAQVVAALTDMMEGGVENEIQILEGATDAFISGAGSDGQQ